MILMMICIEITGPARSGSIFHIDPNQTNAWNVCVKGRKKWIFYPPNQCPPGVVSSPDGADVTGMSYCREHRFTNHPFTVIYMTILLLLLMFSMQILP